MNERRYQLNKLKYPTCLLFSFGLRFLKTISEDVVILLRLKLASEKKRVRYNSLSTPSIAIGVQAGGSFSFLDWKFVKKSKQRK